LKSQPRNRKIFLDSGVDSIPLIYSEQFTVTSSFRREKFHTSGVMVTERNWVDIYGKYEKWVGKKVPKFEGDLTETTQEVF
jgi:DNA topoisomerase IA